MYWRSFFVKHKSVLASALFILTVLFVIAICSIRALSLGKTELELFYPEGTVKLTDKALTLVCYVHGEVSKEGVYALPYGSRIEDVLLAAKPKKQADLSAFNLASPLYDGQKIYIPKDGEIIKNTTLIDINTATSDILATLPGIGEALAEKIVEYRNLYGNFTDINGILNVRGIGNVRFEMIKELICVGGRI